MESKVCVLSRINMKSEIYKKIVDFRFYLQLNLFYFRNANTLSKYLLNDSNITRCIGKVSLVYNQLPSYTCNIVTAVWSKMTIRFSHKLTAPRPERERYGV